MTLHATFRKIGYELTGRLEARHNGLRIGGPWGCQAGALRPINAIKPSAEAKADIALLVAEYGPHGPVQIIEE